MSREEPGAKSVRMVYFATESDLGLFVFLPGVFLSSRVTGACPVTTDLIMRVNVRTTTMGRDRKR